MRRLIVGFLVIGAISLTGLSAQAQDAPSATNGDPSTGVVYKQKTVYDFDADTVEGDLVRPDGEFVGSRIAAKWGTLIKIRPDFVPEMLKSADDI